MHHTKEIHFEAAIEQDLLNQGFIQASPSGFNARFALDEANFWAFLSESQADKLADFRRLNPNDWQAKILARLDNVWKREGILHLFKKGLDVDNVHLDLFFVPPLANSPQRVAELFAQNRFSVMRQVPYSTQTNETVDMAVFINGLPFATMELKNEWTGQSTYHAKQQYRHRDNTQALFQPARTLVHFAIDSQEAYMTTKICGNNTFFLPFNRGNQHGKGNPPNPNGFCTAYLWQDVFQKQSIAGIILHFARLEFDDERKKDLSKATLYFPRYHQLDVVRKLVADVAQNGVGKRYLIQHSAGSGKSNSITWLAFHLIEIYGKASEKPVFDSVIVVTDRKVLDKQVSDNIRAFSSVKNIIAHADRAADLKNAMENGKRIIITTIQKFPFIVDGIADMADKKFAVIIDEAHSSQSGSAHDNMNRAMGAVEESDAQDLILSAMQARKMRHNASYFAFTATPKNSTLEKFGEKQTACTPDNKPIFKPFHLYSMKQAIEEGFILDVLKNYTTYHSFYEVQKSVEENPEFDVKKAQQRLKAFVERTPESIAVKADIMLSHFLDRVVKTKRLKGKAKAMVITQNIETAIRYYQAICQWLDEKGNPFKAMVAFSGEKNVDGVVYTESQLNGFDENKTKAMFDTDDYRILVVANKYLTGFDQPKLCAMYVDKPLAGVLCVQALSRLNRSSPKYGKSADDLFILDFFNKTEDIQAAFEPFYTETELEGETDIHILYDLQYELDEAGVYELDEVSHFVARFFAGAEMAELQTLNQVCANRFNQELGWEHDQKVDFKIKAKQFVKVYNQMASIIAFENREWEKRYWFLKLLIPKLNVADDEKVIDDLLEKVNLSSYALAISEKEHAIVLSDETGTFTPSNRTVHGTHEDDEERDELDNIIKTFNARWFDGWGDTPEERKIRFVAVMEKIQQHKDFESKYLAIQDPALRQVIFSDIVKEVMRNRREQEMEIYRQFMRDDSFQRSLIADLQRAVNIR
ncbi:DEAD/DEAH box helicase [Bibersteinia trehalosi Y31]|uniref:DEAD/DEAH box helicase n=1 Tax=Bibersteinia trehalosi Y31 TaxID=1261658 RepID=A0A179CVZ5_BIBTR|nr:DEAD/DEAH box helicase family protein [Bibersteinia trehalosi]OAQ14069.1 DEAD/DEAH box helicase [Bibersteinia trehalosi Y31]